MKKLFKSTIAVALAATPLMFTSCLEETIPTSGVTQEQLNESPLAAEGVFWAMPAYFNNFETVSEQHYDWGYGSLMHIFDVMTEDMAVVVSGYDHYTAWEEVNVATGEEYLATQFLWNYMNKLVLTTNTSCATFQDNDSPKGRGAYAAARAMRAFAYLTMAQMWEYLPVLADNYGQDPVAGINNDGNCVLHLTVPIVTNNTSEQDARNNPRATRSDMFKFLEADLNYAEENISNNELVGKTVPTLAVVHGLKARMYMWVACNYVQIEGDSRTAADFFNLAYEHATQAISVSGAQPLTQAQWTDPKNGFNTSSVSSWLWAMQTVSEDDVVKSGIVNWTSWSANEFTDGYNYYGPLTMAGASFYSRISNSDFRKLSWVAPDGHPLSGQESYASGRRPSNFVPLTAIKFRPGQGELTEATIACAVGIPLMRVEEMYFIAAEAKAQVAPAEGKAYLETFMKQFRNANYACAATTQDGIIDEIFFQKRVELWGEGLSFFDYKRLNASVTRGYSGTNFGKARQFNTQGRPAWMNFVIVQTERNNNEALVGMNNPAPSGVYPAQDF